AFVGMTRARAERYLCHARLRDFRGSTLYAIPSTFIGELPEDVARIDQSDGARVAGTMDRWRSGGPAAAEGWLDAGIPSRTEPIPPAHPPQSGGGEEGAGAGSWPGRVGRTGE